MPEKDDLMTDCLCNQYDNSPLPQKYIKEQEFIVTVLPRIILGCFCYINDKIYVDADEISNIRRINASFLLGHEIGHKISKYIDTKDIYNEISRLFCIPISRKDILEETLADLVGFVVSNNGSFSYPIDTDNRKKEYAKRKVLTSIYRI